MLFIKDAHTKDSKEFDSFPPHCIKGTEEAELVDELKPYEQVAMSIEKIRPVQSLQLGLWNSFAGWKS